MKRITDPTFRYVRSDKTDLKLTFARIRRQMKQPERATVTQLKISTKR